MYECGKLKKVIGNKILFQVILEQCVYNKQLIRTFCSLERIGTSFCQGTGKSKKPIEIEPPLSKA